VRGFTDLDRGLKKDYFFQWLQFNLLAIYNGKKSSRGRGKLNY